MTSLNDDEGIKIEAIASHSYKFIESEKSKLHHSIKLEQREGSCNLSQVQLCNRNKIILKHLDLVVCQAHILIGHGHQMIDFEDLVSEGVLGLINAASKYDETQHGCFVVYSTWFIKESMMKFLSVNNFPVRVPIKKYKVIKFERDKIVDFDQNASKQLTLGKLTSTSKEYSVRRSLIVDDREGLILYEQKGDIKSVNELLIDRQTTPHGIYEIGAFWGRVREIITELPTRERFIVENRLSSNSSKAMSYKELGNMVGLGIERTRQVHLNAVRRIRVKLHIDGWDSLPSDYRNW